MPASKDEQVPTAVEDPPQHVELMELAELAGPPLALGAQPDTATVRAEFPVAGDLSVVAKDPSEIVPVKVVSAEGQSAEADRVVQKISVDACDDDECVAGVHAVSLEVSDEDHSTVAPSDTDVSSDEDHSIVDVDGPSASFDCDLHDATLCSLRPDLDIDEEVHERASDRVVDDDCRKHSGSTVVLGETRQLDEAPDIVGTEKEDVGSHVLDEDVLDVGWEDRGAAAAAKMLRRILSRAAPVAEVLPLPVFSGSRRRVRFDMGAIILHEITPYSEIYGAHPRTFVFDRNSRRVPAAPNGYVGLQAVAGEDEDEDLSGDSSSDEEEIAIFECGTMCDSQDSEAKIGAEDSWESYLDEWQVASGDNTCSSPTENVCTPSCGLRWFLGA